MPVLTPNEWIVLILVFVLGLVIGMALMAGNKWKGRYRDENRRVRELEAENAQLRKDASEMDTLRGAAARDEARRRVDGPGPL
ncbi:MAG: LapA family protein [Alphaproteobacteria bacterium]|nr:MAG: LapA family protein [Alphaproteobacteria bacterium]